MLISKITKYIFITKNYLKNYHLAYLLFINNYTENPINILKNGKTVLSRFEEWLYSHKYIAFKLKALFYELSPF